jgi:signal transduction histidine kinase
MYLSWMEIKLNEHTDAALAKSLLEKIRMMADLIDATIDSIQKIATELRPSVLDDLGLIAAIEWQAQEFQKRTAIKCEFLKHPVHMEIDEKRSTALFRIFQESLTNVARHAHATHVKVTLAEEEGTAFLEVRDDGVGIKSDEIEAAKSLGLLGMKERAHAFGGEVEFNPAPGGGTIVTVRIPLEREQDVEHLDSPAS